MTTIEYPITEKMHGSSRMTTVPDSPWWIVRLPLLATLAGSVVLAATVFHFVGSPHTGSAFTARPLVEWMQLLGTMPTMIAFTMFACAILLRRNSTGLLRILCVLLTLASLAGVWNSALRDSHGRGPIERWVENVLA